MRQLTRHKEKPVDENCCHLQVEVRVKALLSLDRAGLTGDRVPALHGRFYFSNR